MDGSLHKMVCLFDCMKLHSCTVAVVELEAFYNPLMISIPVSHQTASVESAPESEYATFDFAVLTELPIQLTIKNNPDTQYLFDFATVLHNQAVIQVFDSDYIHTRVLKRR